MKPHYVTLTYEQVSTKMTIHCETAPGVWAWGAGGRTRVCFGWLCAARVFKVGPRFRKNLHQEKIMGQRGRRPVQPLEYVNFTKVIILTF